MADEKNHARISANAVKAHCCSSFTGSAFDTLIKEVFAVCLEQIGRDRIDRTIEQFRRRLPLFCHSKRGQV